MRGSTHPILPPCCLGTRESGGEDEERGGRHQPAQPVRTSGGHPGVPGAVREGPGRVPGD